jgi:hypothetical protein
VKGSRFIVLMFVALAVFGAWLAWMVQGALSRSGAAVP